MTDAPWYETGPLGWIVSLVLSFAEAIWNIGYAILNPGPWLAWLTGLETPEQKESLMRFVFYGASHQFLFAVLLILIVFTAVGMWRRDILWGGVRVLEGFANALGRTVAWAGLLMVLQQILIIFLQRVFRVASISIGPFGLDFTQDLSWYSEELKLYNAMIVALCVSWTFVQGGHVRVDLVYAAVGHRAKRMLDMLGCAFFMLPMAAVLWLYAWFFMWRNLLNPPVSASDPLDRMLLKAKAVRWSVETIGFSPNGFNAYFLFKVLILLFAGLVFLQAWAFFWRSWLEYVEGEDSVGRYLDRDVLGDADAEIAAEIH